MMVCGLRKVRLNSPSFFKKAGTANMQSSRFLKPSIAALAILWLNSLDAQATIMTYGNTSASTVFTVSCSGPADGGLPNASFDNRNFFKAGSDCTNDPFTSLDSSSFASGNVSASGSASASFGTLHGSAAMSTDAQTSVRFPAGFGDAGWIDTMLIEIAGQGGQIATAFALVNVTGTLFAQGVNVSSFFQLYVGSELDGADKHRPFHQIQSFNNVPESLIISDSFVLPLRFVVGTPSQFTVRAQARAMTSSSTSGGNNVSNVNFLTSVTWGGIQSISIGGTEITDPFAATGTVSGVNWANPAAVAAPAPASLLLFLTGLATLVLTRRAIAAGRARA